MKENIFDIYYPDVIPELSPFLSSPEMKRIDEVGMHCGMEYTKCPFYCDFQKYSRYEHSFGVALIVYHFTHDIKETLAGLFHDIATPTFAHVIDFLYGDHDKQEATESRTSQIIQHSCEIQAGLKRLGLNTSDVDDYHQYPIADNDSPKLSADRLEYTLHNLFNYHFATQEEIQEMYDDLMVGTNEFHEAEMMFQHPALAKKFTLLTLRNSQVYVADADRYCMEYLARMLKRLIQKDIITEEELYQTEPYLIGKLCSTPEGKEAWQDYTSIAKVGKVSYSQTSDTFKISAKKRFIDPFVIHQGRISQLDDNVKSAIDKFRQYNFDYYLKRQD